LIPRRDVLGQNLEAVKFGDGRAFSFGRFFGGRALISPFPFRRDSYSNPFFFGKISGVASEKYIRYQRRMMMENSYVDQRKKLSIFWLVERCEDGVNELIVSNPKIRRFRRT